MRRAWIGLALVLFSVPVSAQPVEPPSAEDVSIQAFLQAVEASVLAMDRQRWIDLLAASPAVRTASAGVPARRMKMTVSLSSPTDCAR